MNTKNLTAEMAVVGSLFVDAKAAMPKLIESISPEKFENPILRRAYLESIKLFSDYGYVDVIPLLHKISEDFSEAECKVMLAHCVNELGNIKALPSYIKAMNDCYKARELSKLCEQYAFYEDKDNIDNKLEEFGSKINELLQDNRKKGLTNINDVLLEQYNRLFDKESLQYRLRTGFPKFDEIIKGIYRKNLVIIAARTGLGKSAMALSLALEFSKTAKNVAFYSLEMGIEELFERMIANLAEINLGVIQDRDIGEFSAKNIAAASNLLAKLPIYINDSGYQTVQSIRAEIQIKKIDVVVIDYLQLLAPGIKTDTRNNELAKITRDLKRMAQDLNIPVIALSQLNRSKDEIEEPSLRDLRDSGAIEQDANMVWFMWNNGELQNDSVKQIVLRVAKNRQGKIGEVVLNYRGALMKFEETNFIAIRNKHRKSSIPWEEVPEKIEGPW